jgi:hypothetical protein
MNINVSPLFEYWNKLRKKPSLLSFEYFRDASISHSHSHYFTPYYLPLLEVYLCRGGTNSPISPYEQVKSNNLLFNTEKIMLIDVQKLR